MLDRTTDRPIADHALNMVGWLLAAGEAICVFSALGFGLARIDFWPVRQFRAVAGFGDAFWAAGLVGVGLAAVAWALAVILVLVRKPVAAPYWICIRLGLLVVLAAEVLLFAHEVLVRWASFAERLR